MATAASNDVSKRPGVLPAYRFPPGLQGNLLWFALRKLRPANPIVLFQQLARDYGDIAHYRIGWHHIVFLNHPDYIREVLVVQNDNFIKERTVRRSKMLLGEGMITSEGVQHRTQRQVAQPAFHRQRIPEYANTIVREAARMRDCWRDGEQRDIAIDMMHLTLNMVAGTLFATDLRGGSGRTGRRHQPHHGPLQFSGYAAGGGMVGARAAARIGRVRASAQAD